MESEDPNEPHLDRQHIARLTTDLRSASVTLSDKEARFLVDAYYIIQEDRKRSGNQVGAMGDEPHLLLSWFNEQNTILESQLKAALTRYSNSKEMGVWMQSIYGIGPVISAGLLAHIDITKCPTAGHIWAFAGLDPTKKWEKGEKRPWNASLKTLCWHIGQCFMKFSNRDDCYYGKLYKEQKEKYLARNDRGENVERAAELLPKYKPNTDAYKWLQGRYPLGTSKRLAGVTGADPKATMGAKAAFLRSVRLETPDPKNGMLSPAHVDAMARRWAVKLFLAHMHDEWWRQETGTEPPLPYAIAHMGHVHRIPPPQ